MAEMASVLMKVVEGGKPEHCLTQPTIDLLKTLCPASNDTAHSWNVEDLLTRLHQIIEATKAPTQSFIPLSASIGGAAIDAHIVCKASDELVMFMCNMCELGGQKRASHGSGKINYISDFFLTLGAMGTDIRVFTTNIDLCVEAALVQLSQRPQANRRPDMVLIDGFESALVPTFGFDCYRRESKSFGDRIPVYLWKLHGSIDWTYSRPAPPSVPNEISDGLAQAGFSDQSIIVRRVDGELWKQLYDSGALHSPLPEDSPRRVVFPTPAKYSQTYTYPYINLYESFRRTLQDIELLICVGTSFPDQHIRSAIRSFVERDNTLLFVADPKMGDEALAKLFGKATTIQPVIQKGFEDFVSEFMALESGLVTKNTQAKASEAGK